MKTQTTKTATHYHNYTVARQDVSRTGNPSPESLERGRRLRKIELINDCRELGESLMEIWEE